MIYSARLVYLLTQAQNRTASFSELEELLQALHGADKVLFTAELEALLDANDADGVVPLDATVIEAMATQVLRMDINLSASQLAEVLNVDPDVKEKALASDGSGLEGKIESTARNVPQTKLLNSNWFRYAAIVLLLIGSCVFYLLYQPSNHPAKPNPAELFSSVVPGSEGAILTLSDGSTVVLDNLGDGLIASQNGSQLVLSNGSLTYDSAQSDSTITTHNTLRTPQGRQFRIKLPDGTMVWLNAMSSISYPTSFSGKDRRVTVSGEVYFEVAQNAQLPFYVKINNRAVVEVLGTSFNVNAYEDETSINTTLISGAIKVQTLHATVSGMVASYVLKPGQQSQLRDQELSLVQNVDASRVLAWKRGSFNLEGASLQDVMKQLQRWYNIEVVYEGEIPEVYFTGEMSRGLQLSSVLKALEEWQIRFRLEAGRKLVVLP